MIPVLGVEVVVPKEWLFVAFLLGIGFFGFFAQVRSIDTQKPFAHRRPSGSVDIGFAEGDGFERDNGRVSSSIPSVCFLIDPC